MTSNHPKSAQHQHHQIEIGGDLRVEGTGHHIDFSQTQIVQIAVDEIKTRSLIETSPYIGLKRFEATDSSRFFGRDQLIGSLLKDLDASNLVLLLGASGSGKSSVVRAGLVPQMVERWGRKFLAITFTPDKDPFESLYASLLHTFKQSEASVARQKGYKTLINTVKSLKPSEHQWLIVIDQFEELFTLTPPPNRSTFINALLVLHRALNQAKWRSVKLVLTMRADFLDRIGAYPQLGQLLQGHIRLVTDMHRDELRLAIEQPAAHNGVVFEQGLVEEIINDVQGQAGSLPLLQYTLDLLWQKDDTSDRTLNTQTYRELGGVRGALQRRVDEIFTSLDSREQLEAKQIFLKLVDVVGSIEEIDLAGRAVSKRVPLMAFRSQPEQQVLQKLVDFNLLVSNREQKSTIEIAHEALISSWKTLKIWIDESKEVIIINNRLRDDTLRWLELSKKNSPTADEELWGGTKLERVLQLQNQRLFEITLGGLTEDEKTFIKHSAERQQRLHQETEAIKQRELELTRKALAQEKRAVAESKKAQAQEHKAHKATQRATVAGAALLIAIMCGLGGFLWQRQQKQFNQLLADVASNVANPDLLPIAKKVLNQGHQLEKAEEFENALAKYQLARDFAFDLQLAAQREDAFVIESANIDVLLGDSTKAIVDLIRAERLPELRNHLELGNIGQLNHRYDPSQPSENRFTPGALKTTYIILIKDTGADANDNGEIASPEEASRIPCEVLLDIEKVWRTLTQQKCGWVGTENQANLEAPECQQLSGQSLTVSILPSSYDLLNRMIECQVPSMDSSVLGSI